MIYATYVPVAPLSKYVDHLWFYEGYAPHHRMERLLPDATCELVIDLRPEPKRLFDRDDFSRAKSFRGSWFSGKQSRYIVIETANNSSMIGVHFKPGGAYPFLSQPLAEITDNVVDLDLLWGRRVNSLRDQIMEAAQIGEKFAIIEGLLMSRLRSNEIHVDRLDGVLCQVMRSPHGMAMRELAARIGITHKHLITLFNKYVGLRPKTYERIFRFQRVLHTVHPGGDRADWENADGPGTETSPGRPSWALIAVDAGYADQAHLIKDFRHFSGLTPMEYYHGMGDYPGYVPIAEATTS